MGKRQTYIKINREYFNSPLWNEKRPRTKAEAYIDLFQMATVDKRDYTTPDFNTTIKLTRGEGVWSIRFLAKRWQWSRGRVETFLKVLKTRKKLKQEMRQGLRHPQDTLKTGFNKKVRQESRQGIMVSYLCDYAVSQDNGLYKKRQQIGQTQDTLETELSQIQDKYNKNKKNKKENIYSMILEFWNKQGIIKHNKITDTIKRKINGKISDGYNVGDIKTAIRNYSKIVFSKEHYWTHKWTLFFFLERGFEQFKDWEVANENYKNIKEVKEQEVVQNAPCYQPIKED